MPVDSTVHLKKCRKQVSANITKMTRKFLKKPREEDYGYEKEISGDEDEDDKDDKDGADLGAEERRGCR
jgi:hypothetical protein